MNFCALNVHTPWRKRERMEINLKWSGAEGNLLKITLFSCCFWFELRVWEPFVNCKSNRFGQNRKSRKYNSNKKWVENESHCGLKRCPFSCLVITSKVLPTCVLLTHKSVTPTCVSKSINETENIFIGNRCCTRKQESLEAESVLSNNSKFRWVKSFERWPDGILSSACLLFHFKTWQGQRQVTLFSLKY